MTIKHTIVMEIQETPTQYLRAMRDEQGREWISTVVKGPRGQEMHFQTQILKTGTAVPALQEIERQLNAANKNKAA